MRCFGNRSEVLVRICKDYIQYFFRSFEITLKCDEAEYPGETDGVKEVHDTQQETRYVCQSVVNKETPNLFNPLTPNNDRHQNSPCNINFAYSTPDITRIKDMINPGEFS